MRKECSWLFSPFSWHRNINNKLQMGQNKGSVSVQLPGCLTLLSSIIPSQSLSLFKVMVKENPLKFLSWKCQCQAVHFFGFVLLLQQKWFINWDSHGLSVSQKLLGIYCLSSNSLICCFWGKLLNSVVGYREGQSTSKGASPLHRYGPQKDKGEWSETQQGNQARHFHHEGE